MKNFLYFDIENLLKLCEFARAKIKSVMLKIMFLLCENFVPAIYLESASGNSLNLHFITT